MAKNTGSTRLVGRVEDGSFEYNVAQFRNEIQSKDVQPEHCYMSPSGAYVIFHKGHNYDANEIEAAKIMADNGIIVHLTSEKDISQATATFINKKGETVHKFSDGRLSMDMNSYEQSTRSTLVKKNKKAQSTVVKDALEHAKDKKARIAVLYDKAGTLRRSDIRRGIRRYEGFANNTHRFDAILIISQSGHVHEWSHYKK